MENRPQSEVSIGSLGELVMDTTYDIFWKLSGEDAVWVETVDDLQQAKKRLITLATTTPGAYLIFDPREHKFIEPFADTA